MESRYHKQILKIITLLVILMFSSCSNTIEEVIVSNDFTGPVVIFYKQDFSKGKSIKEGNRLIILVPEDGIVFTEFLNYDGEFFSRFEHNNSKNKLITGYHTGVIYLDKEIPYTAFYVGDSLNLNNMRKLGYDDLKLIYESNVK